MIIIKIASVDKSNIIEFGSVKKKDIINQLTDTLEFNIIYHSGQTFRPSVNSEVEMYSCDNNDISLKFPSNENLIGYWKLDEREGSVALDSSGNNDGVITGATFVDGKFGKALNFANLTVDRVEISNLLSLFAQLGTYSISCWVYLNATGTNRNIWHFNGGVSNRHSLQITGSTIGFQRYNGSSYSGKKGTYPGISGWHHIVCVNNAGTMLLYVNGVELTTSGNNYAVGPSGNVLTIGYPNSTTNGSGSIDGKVDEFRIYDIALIEDEAKTLYEATKIFSGKIHKVSKKVVSNSKVKYNVRCKDYSYDLNRELVIEGYDDKTVNYIIDNILTNFASGFTDTNVNCDLTITKVTFDRITVSDAIQKLADLTGYSWYIDYDKDIHFFEKNTEVAPYNISDGDGNHITDSMQISDDFSQIKNRVFIKGGEIEGSSRAETFDGDGVKKLFRLANKFDSTPTVEVGGTPKTVGIDFLSNEADFDCFWDYNQKYIRFKTAPAVGADNVEVSGTPLYNLVVQVEDDASILQNGVFEFAKTDKTLKSRDEAVSYAKAEMNAYKNGVIEGSFETYESGLRSGQVITITSTILNVSEDFLIQSVGFVMITTGRFIYKVKLATLRTIGIADFLIGLLKAGDRLIEDKGDVVLEKTVFPLEDAKISDSIDIDTDDYPQTESPEIEEALTVQAIDYDVIFVVGPTIPVGTKRIFIIDGSRIG